ncbi:MAG: GLPGLI family protein, partial [Sphingobacteriales bacterium]
FAMYDKEDLETTWMKEMMARIPKVLSDVYELQFTSETSVYRLAKENTDNKYLWGRKPSIDDITVKDLKTNRIKMQKDVYEETFLIEDSLRNCEWRITNETRKIAGFECKKAVTKICDSVYVVAFYTDEIMVSSGPESFGNLPGMILGLAVPRLNTTWFATKVELTEPTAKQLYPKQKGKKVNWHQYNTSLSRALKDWGKYGSKVLWTNLL